MISKFRVWDIRDKKFLSLDELDIRADLGWDKTENSFQLHIKNKMGLPEEVIVNWFTGLHDKNGKEIYERDIVKCEGYPKLIIKFHKGAFTGYQIGDETDIGIKWDLFTFRNDRLEIIGNIYEHPHLLTPKD